MSQDAGRQNGPRNTSADVVAESPPAWFQNRPKNTGTPGGAFERELADNAVTPAQALAAARAVSSAHANAPAVTFESLPGESAGQHRLTERNPSRPPHPPRTTDDAWDEGEEAFAEEPFEWVIWWHQFQDWLKQWFTGSGGRATAVSTACHAVLLLILALILVQQNNDEEVVTTMLPPETPEVISFEELPEQVSLMPEFKEQPNPLADESTAPSMDLDISGALSTELGQESGEMSGFDAISDSKLFPAGAVTKGSFTVWTKPEDPAPGENYKIIIRVSLEKAGFKDKKYPLRDLAGTLVGTDGYKQAFPVKTSVGQPDYLIVRDGYVDHEVFVPGAFKLVKDTIKVKSYMLKEEQTLQIVF